VYTRQLTDTVEKRANRPLSPRFYFGTGGSRASSASAHCTDNFFPIIRVTYRAGVDFEVFCYSPTARVCGGDPVLAVRVAAAFMLPAIWLSSRTRERTDFLRGLKTPFKSSLF